MDLQTRVSDVKIKISSSLEIINNCIKEIQEIESNVDKLTNRLNIKILSFPNDKLFRLRDEKLTNSNIITSDIELEKSIEYFIEDISVEKVSFNEGYHYNNTEKSFKVEYKTHGYMYHKNTYYNEDFGKFIFTSRNELIDVVTPIFEKSKQDYIIKKEEDKVRRKEQLEKELDKLK